MTEQKSTSGNKSGISRRELVVSALATALAALTAPIVAAAQGRKPNSKVKLSPKDLANLCNDADDGKAFTALALWCAFMTNENFYQLTDKCIADALGLSSTMPVTRFRNKLAGYQDVRSDFYDLVTANTGVSGDPQLYVPGTVGCPNSIKTIGKIVKAGG